MILEGRSALDFKTPEEVRALQRKGEQLFASLQRKGQHPVWVQAIESGMIAMGFDIMGIGQRENQWIKAFIADGDVADEKAFLMQMREWKDKVLKDIAIHMPSAAVRDAIQRHTLPKVMEALRR